MKAGDGSRIPWYRIPVLWLGIVVFAALLVGCVVNVVVALQLSDTALAEVAPSARFGFAVDDGSDRGQ